jgi:histidine triad (HIT) family protein
MPELGRPYNTKDGCPFCDEELIKNPILFESRGVIVFEPLGPVVPGHVLVVPRAHVENFADRPLPITAKTAQVAGEYCRAADIGDANLISSKGAAATQSVEHLHFHIVPRTPRDGLQLPWPSPRAPGEWMPGCAKCKKKVSGYNELRYGHCIDCLIEPGVLAKAKGAHVMDPGEKKS